MRAGIGVVLIIAAGRDPARSWLLLKSAIYQDNTSTNYPLQSPLMVFQPGRPGQVKPRCLIDNAGYIATLRSARSNISCRGT